MKEQDVKRHKSMDLPKFKGLLSRKKKEQKSYTAGEASQLKDEAEKVRKELNWPKANNGDPQNVDGVAVASCSTDDDYEIPVVSGMSNASPAAESSTVTNDDGIYETITTERHNNNDELKSTAPSVKSNRKKRAPPVPPPPPPQGQPLQNEDANKSKEEITEPQKDKKDADAEPTVSENIAPTSPAKEEHASKSEEESAAKLQAPVPPRRNGSRKSQTSTLSPANEAPASPEVQQDSRREVSHVGSSPNPKLESRSSTDSNEKAGKISRSGSKMSHISRTTSNEDTKSDARDNSEANISRVGSKTSRTSAVSQKEDQPKASVRSRNPFKRRKESQSSVSSSRSNISTASKNSAVKNVEPASGSNTLKSQVSVTPSKSSEIDDECQSIASMSRPGSSMAMINSGNVEVEIKTDQAGESGSPVETGDKDEPVHDEHNSKVSGTSNAEDENQSVNEKSGLNGAIGITVTDEDANSVSTLVPDNKSMQRSLQGGNQGSIKGSTGKSMTGSTKGSIRGSTLGTDEANQDGVSRSSAMDNKSVKSGVSSKRQKSMTGNANQDPSVVEHRKMIRQMTDDMDFDDEDMVDAFHDDSIADVRTVYGADDEIVNINAISAIDEDADEFGTRRVRTIEDLSEKERKHILVSRKERQILRDLGVQTRKVDDDFKRKLNRQSDVSMVTRLQPAEMLRSEMVLHEAARKNSIDKVRQLIQERVDVNSRNNLDRTALQWAAANGHCEVLTVLLAAKASIEAQDKYGMRAVLWAAWFGHSDALRILVNNGANIHASNKQGLTILHCAAQNNHSDAIKFILESLENYDINQADRTERTALHAAAEKGHMEAVQQLLDANIKVDAKDKVGQTAVHLAAANGNTEVLDKLLRMNIEVGDRDNDGKTVLHCCSENGHLKAVETVLLHQADVNAETVKENTALHLAALNGHIDVVTALLTAGCNVSAQNNQGNTAVHVAAMHNHPDIIKLFVDCYADLNVGNNRHQTALHVAVENGFSDVVEILLIAGADIEAKEKTGKTPLMLASRGSFIGIVDMIIKADRWQQLKEQGIISSVPNGDVTFRKPKHDTADYMRSVLWKLATKQLKQTEWKKLAMHWGFNEKHIRAIEHQYTGPYSYKEHGFRLLLIWLHGVKKDDSPTKELFESLTAIGRHDLAELIRKKTNLEAEKSGHHSNSNKGCAIS